MCPRFCTQSQLSKISKSRMRLVSRSYALRDSHENTPNIYIELKNDKFILNYELFKKLTNPPVANLRSKHATTDPSTEQCHTECS